jgi:hypothetical protein
VHSAQGVTTDTAHAVIADTATRAMAYVALNRLTPVSYSAPVCSLVSIDLLGRTGLARLHLRVRFAVTDEMPTLSMGPVGPSQDLWTGGSA